MLNLQCWQKERNKKKRMKNKRKIRKLNNIKTKKTESNIGRSKREWLHME